MTRSSTIKRHNKVIAEFKKLAGKKEYGVTVFSYELMVKKLSDKYDYSEKTVGNILKKLG